MKYNYVAKTDKPSYNNMYPPIYDHENVLVIVKSDTIVHNYIGYDNETNNYVISPNPYDMLIWPNLDKALATLDEIVDELNIKHDDITIMHSNAHLCRKCGMDARKKGMLLCIPCSYS